MQDDPAEIARRAAIVREAAFKARAAGRLAPTIAELNAALGDEEGVSNQARVLAGRTPKRYGITSQIDRGPGGGRGRHHGSRTTHHGPRED